MLNGSASLAMSTSVLKALPGKLDIKRHFTKYSLFMFQFPLFDSLLREGVSDQHTEPSLIPATAPILHVHRNTKSSHSYEAGPQIGVRNPQLSQPDIADSTLIVNAWHNTRRMSEENKESNGQLPTERDASG